MEAPEENMGRTGRTNRTGQHGSVRDRLWHPSRLYFL